MISGDGFNDMLTNTNVCFINTDSDLMMDMECEGILLSINTQKNSVLFVISITSMLYFCLIYLLLTSIHVKYKICDLLYIKVLKLK